MKASRIMPLVLAALLALPTAASAQYRRHDRHNHDNSGAAAAAIVGLAILGVAAAAASSRNRDRDRYDTGYSPARGVVCYRDQRRCFWRDRFSMEWTDSEFGYDPYRRGY